MMDRLERMESKIDDVGAKLQTIDKSLAVIASSHASHGDRLNSLDERLAPVVAHVLFVKKATKLSAWIVGLLVSVLGWMKKDSL